MQSGVRKRRKCRQWDGQRNECNEQLRQAFSEIVRGGGNLKIFS